MLRDAINGHGCGVSGQSPDVGDPPGGHASSYGLTQPGTTERIQGADRLKDGVPVIGCNSNIFVKRLPKASAGALGET